VWKKRIKKIVFYIKVSCWLYKKNEYKALAFNFDVQIHKMNKIKNLHFFYNYIGVDSNFQPTLIEWGFCDTPKSGNIATSDTSFIIFQPMVIHFLWKFGWYNTVISPRVASHRHRQSGHKIVSPLGRAPAKFLHSRPLTVSRLLSPYISSRPVPYNRPPTIFRCRLA